MIASDSVIVACSQPATLLMNESGDPDVVITRSWCANGYIRCETFLLLVNAQHPVVGINGVRVCWVQRLCLNWTRCRPAGRMNGFTSLFAQREEW